MQSASGCSSINYTLYAIRYTLLSAVYLNVEVFYAPFECFFVRWEENIKPVPPDKPAPVKYLHWLSVVVARYYHLAAERVFFIGRYKSIAFLYLIIARRRPVRIFSAAFRTRTIRRYSHPLGLPFAIRLVISARRPCFRFIKNLLIIRPNNNRRIKQHYRPAQSAVIHTNCKNTYNHRRQSQRNDMPST